MPSVPWRFLSLSLSTPVPTLPGKPQCFRLQSQGHQSVQTSVKPHCSCTLPNLRCSTTHVLSQKHVATKPRSLTKQIRPSRFSCQTFSFQLPSPGMTPGSVAPRTVHSVRPGSTTTWPTCRDVTLSHATFLIWTYAALLPSSPFSF